MKNFIIGFMIAYWARPSLSVFFRSLAQKILDELEQSKESASSRLGAEAQR